MLKVADWVKMYSIKIVFPIITTIIKVTNTDLFAVNMIGVGMLTDNAQT